jgi:pimeloyl-ACP methyl ester carboxylesterase
VLVHGFLDMAYTWHEIGDRLATRAHVIAPDLRGHGDSDWVGAGGYYHFFDYLPDLDEVIERYARKRLVVVGHSMGGSVCTYWAGMRPERLSALALLEGLGPPDQTQSDLPARTAQWIGAWRRVRTEEKGMATLADAAARLRKYDPMLREELSLRLAAAGTRDAGGRLVWKRDPLHMTMGPYPFRRDAAAEFWSRITCPVLIVDAAQTQFNLADAERAERRALFRDPRHVTIDQAGHMMQRHQPDKLAELLLELL